MTQYFSFKGFIYWEGKKYRKFHYNFVLAFNNLIRFVLFDPLRDLIKSEFHFHKAE